MIELEILISEMLNENLQQIILSNSTDKEIALKVKVRPVLLQGALVFQETLYRGTQVFHSNHVMADMKNVIIKYMTTIFKQAQFNSNILQATVLISKKGKITIKKHGNNLKSVENGEINEILSHDRQKQYILKEGQSVDFLVGLGVQTKDGKVSKAKYDKFRQINRYLEFIEDVIDELPKDRTIRIIDFGCGKSYLTFAMYYYLHELQDRNVEITGLDLKEEVINHCNNLARQCGYENLSFEKGDISTYQGADQVDMVVSLHACDVATDYAIEKAVKWGAKVIMAVPCCQHEVNKQIKCDQLAPVLKYGLIKERMSALITDAVRANILEKRGYDTQILEFIDMEHTPKNLLIRAVKRQGMRPKTKDNVDDFMEFINISPTLAKLLTSQNNL